MTIARASGLMRIECLFRSAVGRSEKCVEDSGGVQPRQENSAECGTKSQHRLNSSGLRTRTALGLRLWKVVAYAFPMRYVLGFDGGGTKTDCVLMDETGAILARSRSGPSNPSRVALDAAFETVVEAGEKALAAAGKTASDVADFCGAIGGVGIAGAIPEFRKRLKLRFPNARSAFVVTDLSMALAAAGEPPCIVVIAGTGSAAYGRVDHEKTARDGGFGPVLGDPGSAYDISRKAGVAEWRRLFNGGESHPRNEILDTFKCNWVELNSMISSNPDRGLPRIFPLVAHAAHE